MSVTLRKVAEGDLEQIMRWLHGIRRLPAI